MGNIQDVFGGHEFDCNQVDPAQAYEPLAAGWYNAMVAEAEVKATKKGDGHYLKLTLQVFDTQTGQLSNRKVFSNINLRNPNPKCEEIGQRELSALGHATGTLRVTDTADLVNKTCQIKVAVTNDEQYGPGNEVKGFKPLEGAQAAAPAGQPAAAAPAAAPAPAAPAAPAGGYVPPWKQKK